MNALALAAWLACQSFDATTTTVALGRGYAEGNVIMSKGHIPIRISINIGMLLAYRKTKAKVIPITLAASGCAAGTWNTYQMRKDK